MGTKKEEFLKKWKDVVPNLLMDLFHLEVQILLKEQRNICSDVLELYPHEQEEIKNAPEP